MPITAHRSTSVNPAHSHGGGVRGDAVPHRSAQFTGRFGRLFRDLPPADWPDAVLRALGLAMTAAPETDPADPAMPAAAPETDEILQDDEENSGIPAGYTYFGQFVDHDITFDPASTLMKLNDPEALVDFRTPRLDLDSLYGRGPDDQPYLFVGNRFRLGRPLTEGVGSGPSHARGHAVNLRDLPRYEDVDDPALPKRALIGDKRNDENVIVSQLQASFLQFHNRLVDVHPESTFAEIQQLVRWHYQWLVLNDFLVRICGREIVDELLPHRLERKPAEQKRARLSYYHWRNDPFMPIEFSVAAYRFGHSMVRPVYRLNTVLDGGANPLAATEHEREIGLAGRFFIFAGVKTRGLDGFDAFPSPWAVDWSLFFDIPGVARVGGKERVQPSYKIDTVLTDPLGFLPEFSRLRPPAAAPMTVERLHAEPVDAQADPANLAVRNLLRGKNLRLPSGQAVADALGVPRIPDDQLVVGKATLGASADGPVKLTDVDPSFAGNAPLWYYVLAEAQVDWLKRAKAAGSRRDAEPVRLGPVGRRIVAETLVGLVAGDGMSYLNQSPNFEPVVDGQRLDTVGALLAFAVRP